MTDQWLNNIYVMYVSEIVNRTDMNGYVADEFWFRNDDWSLINGLVKVTYSDGCVADECWLRNKICSFTELYVWKKLIRDECSAYVF